jgi:hypothetical protein
MLKAVTQRARWTNESRQKLMGLVNRMHKGAEESHGTEDSTKNLEQVVRQRVEMQFLANVQAKEPKAGLLQVTEGLNG